MTASKFAVLTTNPDTKSGNLALSNRLKSRSSRKKKTRSIMTADELEVGDYVVHDAYGIGIYKGIENLTIGGVSRDYISIQYAGSDKLFLPINQLDLVSKYIGSLTDSEIFVILVSGMGSMSASILGGYTALGIPMSSLLIASALVPIGSIMVSKIIFPQTDEVVEVSDVRIDNKGNNSNVIDALSEGANTGIHMVISIGASIIGFVGIVALIDLVLSVFNITLSEIFSYIFSPFGYLLGFEGDEIFLEGSLLGNKLILNEFIAFGQLAPVLESLDERTALVAAISLSGFANISSMGMCIGGIGVLAPEKRGTISRLIFKAMLGGVFVSINSAFLVSIVSLI